MPFANTMRAPVAITAILSSLAFASEPEAVRLRAQTEGILLDPVYTGRAFGGLLSMLRKQPAAFTAADRSGPANVLFWHTGGQPALFAYAADLG